MHFHEIHYINVESQIALSKSIVCFTCYRNNKSVQCNVKVFCFGRQNLRVAIVDWCVATCKKIALNIIYAKQKSMVWWLMEWLYSKLEKKKINSLVTPNAITWLINGITHFHGMHFWAIVQGNTVGCNDWINRWCKVRHNWTNVIFRILSVVEFIPYCCWQIKVGLFLCMCINRNW